MTENNPFHADRDDSQPAQAEGLDYTPPQDLAAEHGVLRAMLFSRDAIDTVATIIKGKHFYRPAHELIHDAIVDLHGRGEPADPITVAAELTKRGDLARAGGPSYLHTIANSPGITSNAEEYAEIVREKWVARDFAQGLMRARGELLAGRGDPSAVIAEIQAQIADVEGEQAEDGLHLSGASMEGTLDKLEEIAENKGRINGIPTGFADLDALTRGWQGGQFILVAARPAMGKALALDTPLPTPTGWTTMGDVQPGDHLISADGKPTRVVAATEVMHGRPCFEVEFSDGSVIVADAEHQWLTDTRASIRSEYAAKHQRYRTRNQRTFPAVRTTAQIAQTLRCDTADRRLNHCVTVASAAQLPEANLPLGPYTLGVWLGDGTSVCSNITTPDPEVIAEIEAEGYRVKKLTGSLQYNVFLPERPDLPSRSCVVCGVEFRPATSQIRTCGRSCGGRAKTVSAPVPQPTCPDCGKPYTGLKGLCRACRAHHGTVPAILRSLGVLGSKRIPAVYLRASESQRRALLAGLLDSDGYCSKQGGVQFAVTKELLARDVWELVLSLGYKATLTSKPARLNGRVCGTVWTVTFTTSDRVFRLPRKAARLNRATSPLVKRRFIVDVRPVPSVPVRCVQVDNVDHLYVAGRTWIPTHNSTLALDFQRACSIVNGLPSVLFSLEMGRHEVNMRLLSAEARVGLHHMRSGVMTDDDWTRVARRMPEVTAAPLYIDDSPNLDLMQIRAKCRRLKERNDLKLVIIDYLQLMGSGSTKRFESRQIEVSFMSRNLKLLAKELDVPIIALSQLNRGPEQRTDKKPMVSDLRESGSLEQDADMVILLHREDAYEKESARAGEADLIVGKHRAGATATITVAAQLHYSRFVDMTRDDEPN